MKENEMIKWLLRDFAYSKCTTIGKLTCSLHIMEVTQFYLRLLVIVVSILKFPNNTLTAEYRVGLPQTVSLTGDKEVALTEIQYLHSWNNVHGNFQNRSPERRIGRNMGSANYPAGSLFFHC